MSALRTTLQVLAVVCLLILAAAGVLVLSRLLHWPLATVGLAVLALVLLVLAARFAPGLLSRLAEARARARATGTGEAAARVAALRGRWKLLVQQLAGSRLGRRAVEGLPFYVLLGETDSGKSAALRNCRRTVAGPGGAGAAEGKAGELGWALLDRAVVLDAPSSFVRPADEADRAQYSEFLSLLARTRRKLPLDAAVVVVAADALLRKRPEELKADASLLRERLDEAIRRLGVRLPVYLLVTRWDRLEGMGRFFQCFPEPAQAHAVGSVAPAGAAPAAFAESVIDRLSGRLRELRLTLLGDGQLRESHRAALLLPEETAALREPLAAYAATLFAEDPYRETAALRGIYFGSARQGGKAVPGVLSRLGFPEEELPATEEERSFFLSGFFGDVLPGDRGLAAPTQRALTLRSLTRHLGLTAWLALFVVLGLALTASFTRNLAILRDVARGVPSRADLTGRLDADLAAVDRLRDSAERLHRRNTGWGVGRVLLPQAKRAEEQLWAEHDRRFRAAVLEPLDKAYEARLDRLLAEGSPQEVAGAVDLTVKRIKLVKLAGAGAPTAEELAAAPQPNYAWFADAPSAAFSATFRRNYLAHLARAPGALGPELARQGERLQRLLGREGASLDWVVDWANLQAGVKPVRLSDFWGAGTGEASVEGAFTPAGWTEIERFLGQIGSAASEGGGFAAARARFQASYRQAYLARWERFLQAFPTGAGAWRDPARRVELAGRLAGRDSPYAKLLAALPEALKPAVELAAQRSELPGWVGVGYRYERLREPAYQAVLKSTQSGLGLAAAKGGAMLGRLWEKLEGSRAEDVTLGEDVRAFPYWLAYQDALVKSSERARSPQASYQLAKDVFLEAELSVGEPQQPISRLYWSLGGLRRGLGRGAAGEEVFWQLLVRQADAVWAAVIGGAEASIESAWQGEVLGAVAGLTGLERVDALQGPTGKVWEFQERVLGPFLTKGFRRPQPKTAYGQSLHFSLAFLDMAGKGKVGQQAMRGSSLVQVSALPTDANPEAAVKPHSTRLLLQCASGAQELVNQNYPVSKTFTWNPQECADVVLEIGVGGAQLKRWYSGPDGFARFLGDFRGGRRTFRPSDFPDQQSALASYRVRYITVNYAFRGHEAVLGSVANAPPRVPERLFP